MPHPTNNRVPVRVEEARRHRQQHTPPDPGHCRRRPQRNDPDTGHRDLCRARLRAPHEGDKEANRQDQLPSPARESTTILRRSDRNHAVQADSHARVRGQQVRRRHPREHGIHRQTHPGNPVSGKEETSHPKTLHWSHVHQLRSLPGHRLPTHIQLLQTTSQHHIRRFLSCRRSRLQLHQPPTPQDHSSLPLHGHDRSTLRRTSRRQDGHWLPQRRSQARDTANAHLLLPLLRKSELEDRVQVLHNRRNHIIHLGIHRSNHRNTFRPILIHNQSLTITAIRPTLHPTTMVRTRVLLHGGIRLLHHGERPDGLPRPILRPGLLDQPSPLDLAVPGRIFRSPTQQLLRLVPSLTNLLRHILSHNQTTNKVIQLRDRLLLPVRPRQCHRRPSLGISLARPSLIHHLHHSNTDHLPSKRRPMEKAARNQRTY